MPTRIPTLYAAALFQQINPYQHQTPGFAFDAVAIDKVAFGFAQNLGRTQKVAPVGVSALRRTS